MGYYKWMTFEEVDIASDHFGNALISLGQKHKENIAIFAETRAEWMISVQGCFKQNIPGELHITNINLKFPSQQHDKTEHF